MPDQKQGSQGGQGTMHPEETGRPGQSKTGQGNIPKNPQRTDIPRKSGEESKGGSEHNR
jgi:hypothetical protein